MSNFPARVEKVLLALFISSFSFGVFADSLKMTELQDQYEITRTINESTQWVIFSDDKIVSDNINQALEDLKITDVNALKGAYVADISKMPSLITKMVALPKMRGYSFKVMLDKEGALTKAWPRKAGKATLLQLKKLEIVKADYVSSTDEIKKFIQAQK